MIKSEKLQKLFQKDPQLRIRVDKDLNTVHTLKGKIAEYSRSELKNHKRIADTFIKNYQDIFGKTVTGRTEAVYEGIDLQGGYDLVLQQHYNGYKVINGSIRFHWDSKGILDTVRNTLFPDLHSVPKKPKLSEETAIKKAFAATKAKGELLSKPLLLVCRSKGKARLVYEIKIADTRKGEYGVPANWIVWVDANNGDVVQKYDNIQTAGPIAGSGTGYYSGGGTLNAFFNDVTNQLRDTTRAGIGGSEIRTDDEDGSSPSEDADANWNNLAVTPRDTNQGAEVDAHRYAAAVFDYFNTVHGRNGYDGAGTTFRTIVHSGSNFNNGYWDGVKVNLGDGDGSYFDYCTTDDWLAHEFTHAYTQYTCGLNYLNESGALNESFSDIFAAFITGDWMVFEDNWLSATAPAARNMIEPTNGGMYDSTNPIPSVIAGHQPSHYLNRYTGASDNGGVHINSGIINNLFYLLVNGGTHAISGITVSGIGQSSAEQMLFRCMSVNLVGLPSATFLDFREAMLDACQDLFPTDLNMLTQVKTAFLAVGIGPDIFVRDNVADTGTEPYPGTYLWASPDIINRTAVSASPTTDFANLSDDSLWQNVEFGQNNYVYVRLQNRGAHNGDVTINIYFIPMSSFGSPAGWIHIGTLSETAITPGSLRISGPLTFPAALIPALGHYCMIAVVSDALDPAPNHNLITSVSDYINFVRNTNNIAYRNMDVVDLIPGAPGVVEFNINTIKNIRERYQLVVELGKAPAGLKVFLRGSARLLDGANAIGLKLLRKDKSRNIYQLQRQIPAFGQAQNIHAGGNGKYIRYGLDNILIDKPEKLNLEWFLPEQAYQNLLKQDFQKNDYQIMVKQLFGGHVVGAFTIKLRLNKEKTAVKNNSRKKNKGNNG